MEEWRMIKDFPMYEVSNFGNVRNTKNHKRIFQRSHTAGYKQVVLYRKGKSNYRYIHRLVAQAFIDNPENLQFINHKDECKSNNNVNNLEWCTPKYNANYGTCKERMGLAHKKKVRQYTKDGVFIREWDSQQEAEQELQLRAGSISTYINSPFHWEESN